MQAFGLKVTDEAGNRVAFSRATGRYVSKFPSVESTTSAQRSAFGTVIDIKLSTSARRSTSFDAWHAWDKAR